MQKERRGAPAGLFSIKEQRLDGRFRGDSPGDGTANVEVQLHEEDGNIPGYKMLPVLEPHHARLGHLNSNNRGIKK